MSQVLKGRSMIGTPTVLTDEPEAMKSALKAFLLAVPRDADHAGVGLDDQGRPIERDLEEAVKRMAYIAIDAPGAADLT